MNIEDRWSALCERIKNDFNVDAGLNGILFLIGIREMGWLPRKFTKEEKQDLIDLGTFVLFERHELCEKVGTDREGWPMWQHKEQAQHLTSEQRSTLLKETSIKYFESIWE